MGTMMFDLSTEMSMSVIFKINEIVTDVTRIEGGRGASISSDGVLLYYDITEEESTKIYDRLEASMNYMVFEWINPVFDDFEGEEVDE